jgi:hypothetical protein
LPHSFNNGNTLYFKITAITNAGNKGATIIPDSIIHVKVDAGINTASLTPIINVLEDRSNVRIKEGVSSVFIDLIGKENIAVAPIRIENIIVKKNQ